MTACLTMTPMMMTAPIPKTIRGQNMKVIAENTGKHKISKYLLEIIALIIGVISKIVVILLKHKYQ